MTKAIFAQGTLLKLGDGGDPETFTTVAEVRSMSGPGFSAATVEVTNHDSPQGYQEFIGGLRQAGTLTFEINLDPNDPTHNHETGVLAGLESGVTHNWQIVFPGGIATWQFQAFVTGFEVNIPVDAQLSASVTLQITGQPNFAAGA